MKGSIFITLFFCFFVIDTNFAQELQGDIALSFKSGKYQFFALLRGEIRESSSSIRFGGGADRKIISAVQASGQSFLSPNPKEVAPYFASKTNKGVYLYFDKDKKCIYHFEYYPGRIKVRRIYSQKGGDIGGRL
jgi:hypothetical protein